MISVKSISKYFGSLCAVDHLSFDINDGEIVGFLGPNGAGKSTTMKMITGFLSTDHGSVSINGFDLDKNPLQAKELIGYLPETSALYTEMTCVDFLKFMGKMRGLTNNQIKKRISETASQCSLTNVLGRKIAALSKGFRQRIGLAQALLHDPKTLILDEPTIGLDPNQIVEIRELIKEIGKTKTILLSSHILPEVSSTCQRLLVINNGKLIAQGTPQELIQNSNKHNKYNLCIRGPINDIKNKLSEEPCFMNLDLKKTKNDLHELDLTCSGDKDLSENLFDLAVKNNWRLSRLNKESRSLEDVFKTLTQ